MAQVQHGSTWGWNQGRGSGQRTQGPRLSPGPTAACLSHFLACSPLRRVYKERLGLSTKTIIGYQTHADTATKSNTLAKNKPLSKNKTPAEGNTLAEDKFAVREGLGSTPHSAPLSP